MVSSDFLQFGFDCLMKRYHMLFHQGRGEYPCLADTLPVYVDAAAGHYFVIDQGGVSRTIGCVIRYTLPDIFLTINTHLVPGSEIHGIEKNYVKGYDFHEIASLRSHYRYVPMTFLMRSISAAVSGLFFQISNTRPSLTA